MVMKIEESFIGLVSRETPAQSDCWIHNVPCVDSHEERLRTRIAVTVY